MLRKFKMHNSENTQSLVLHVLGITVVILFLSLPHQCCGILHDHGEFFENQEMIKTSDWLRHIVLNKRTKLSLEIKPVLSFPILAYPEMSKGGKGFGFHSSAQFAIPLEIVLGTFGDFSFLDAILNVIHPGTGISLFPRRKRDLLESESTLWKKSSIFSFGNQTNVLDVDMDIDIDGGHPGGERAKLLMSVAKTLDGMGLNGRPCLQRAICEIHKESLKEFGLMGEIIELVFSVSKSRFAKTKHLEDFLEAERLGKLNNCYVYMSRCKMSLFDKHHR